MVSIRRPPTLVSFAPKADVRFYVERAREVSSQASGEAGPNGRVLVLGCGSGLLCRALAESGFAVLGVDPSLRMLEAAESLRQGVTEVLSTRLRFLHADVRSLRLEERFALVLAPHNALGLVGSVDELETVMATARHHLEPGGTFAFDLLNPAAPVELEEEEDAHAARLPARPIFAPHLRERRRDEKGGLPAGGIRRFRMRPFRPEEVDRALLAVGLEARERFGRFDGRAFASTDAMQVVVAGNRGA